MTFGRSRSQRAVDDALASLCGALSDLGCVYHTEAASSTATRYVILRRPIQAKIRVSDHASTAFQKNAKRMLEIDVNISTGPTWREAVDAVRKAMADG